MLSRRERTPSDRANAAVLLALLVEAALGYSSVVAVLATKWLAECYAELAFCIACAAVAVRIRGGGQVRATTVFLTVVASFYVKLGRIFVARQWPQTSLWSLPRDLYGWCETQTTRGLPDIQFHELWIAVIASARRFENVCAHIGNIAATHATVATAIRLTHVSWWIVESMRGINWLRSVYVRSCAPVVTTRAQRHALRRTLLRDIVATTRLCAPTIALAALYTRAGATRYVWTSMRDVLRYLACMTLYHCLVRGHLFVATLGPILTSAGVCVPAQVCQWAQTPPLLWAFAGLRGRNVKATYTSVGPKSYTSVGPKSYMSVGPKSYTSVGPKSRVYTDWLPTIFVALSIAHVALTACASDQGVVKHKRDGSVELVYPPRSPPLAWSACLALWFVAWIGT
jgi:ribosomal protein S26